mmetsp:Transcript_11851/g.28355  ORF Transcript_11851/g.28355 Transcript_11851/m.28355 type:complete len:264 (-) Transcript_11851:2497-3288(-)
MHGLDKILGTVLDTRSSIGFEYSTTGTARRRIHFHHRSIDGRIKDYPCATSDFSKWRDEDEHWLLISNKCIDNQRTILQDFIKHIPLSSTESTPVGEYNQRQIFRSEVIDCLGSLVGTVGEPHTSSFLDHSFGRLHISRISWLDILRSAVFCDDNSHRNSTKPGASNDHRLRPSSEGFSETSSVKETTFPYSTVVFSTCEKHSGIIRSSWDRRKVNLSFDFIQASNISYGQESSSAGRNIRQPINSRLHSAQVIGFCQVGNTV